MQKVWVNHDTDLLDLTVTAAGKTSVIHTTAHHPFWDDTRHARTNADHLTRGDRLRTSDGTAATIAGTTIVAGARDMWDLTIPTDHDFYITTGMAGILAHNCPIGENPETPMTTAEAQGYQKGLNPNNLEHIFGQSKHGLDGLVQELGGREAVLQRMYSGLENDVPENGYFQVTRQIGDTMVTVRGSVVNGLPRIGTAYIP